MKGPSIIMDANTANANVKRLKARIMTPRQADKVIASGKPTMVKDAYGDRWSAVFTKRDRRNIETADGGLFDRAELQIVQTPE